MPVLPRHVLVQLAAGGSLGLLAGAFFFQHVIGLAPCEMCIWQRWPHALAILLGVVALAVPRLERPAAGLGALAMAVSAGLALMHTGVERKWWEGITECSVSQGEGMSADQMLAQIMTAPVVRCDEVAWDFLGLSMASWNGLVSLALLGCWLLALRR